MVDSGRVGVRGSPDAVKDARLPFGATITEQPITPERVLRARRPSRDRRAGDSA